MDQLADDTSGLRIHITGIVQGVGFRPFVYSLATRLGLKGWVQNTSAGVDIQVDGSREQLDTFLKGLREETPPLAQIDTLIIQPSVNGGFMSFEIIGSVTVAEEFQPISPDVAICEDCFRELFDPHDRRFHYPFINCTNCGPRFTIITDIPYDRPNTTMAGFPLCPECASEYADPRDRRFHAQPVACPICGPQVWLEILHPPINSDSDIQSQATTIHGSWEAIRASQQLLRQGKIIAIKGLGGFHLACDATNPQAVAELRRRKLRVDKPFALMMANVAVVERHCQVDSTERELLLSRQRPIVILQRRPTGLIAREAAPHQNSLGVMLPYTPLHYLLFAPDDNGQVLPPLIMTSGNLSEEPIAFENDDARQRLASLTDGFLMHNRPIRTRCDDSVVQVFPTMELPVQCANPDSESTRNNRASSLDKIYPVRRSRGFAPFPIHLPWKTPPFLAGGAELKNTFCVGRENYAFLSHHIGDLENYETLRSFEDSVAHFERLFHVEPELLAYDLHPNYLASRFILSRAVEEGLPAIGVQHHHAHIASCMVDNNIKKDQPVIGVAFDGTGYGEDGAIWGGEFLITSYASYQRLAHLAYVPLPGGEAAIRKPARMALAYLWQADLDWAEKFPYYAELSAEERTIVRLQLEKRINSPLTSSAGRLFDAVAALAGVRQRVNYEAQAAIEFEALADPQEPGAYPFEISTCDGDTPVIIGVTRLIETLLSDLALGVPVGKISSRFHNGMAQMVHRVCQILRNQTGIQRVALSGGVWQNQTLLRKTVCLLQANKFDVLTHHQAPTNDGGIALGQAAVAVQRWLDS